MNEDNKIEVSVSTSADAIAAVEFMDEHPFKPNWVKLSERYPEKIKNIEDAKRFIVFCLEKDRVSIAKAGLSEASFFIGGRKIMLSKEGWTKHKDLIPPHIKEFK